MEKYTGTFSNLTDIFTQYSTSRDRSMLENIIRTLISQSPIGLTVNIIANAGEATGGFGRNTRYQFVYDAIIENGGTKEEAQVIAYDSLYGNSDSF